jgi:hypothetical protein
MQNYIVDQVSDHLMNGEQQTAESMNVEQRLPTAKT